MSSSAQYFLPGLSSGSVSADGVVVPHVRRWIDAQTRDYVVELGGLKQDDGFTSKVVLAWATRLGTCQVDPNFGNRFHEIQQVDERGRRLAEAYGLLAIAHLKNEINNLLVSATIFPKDHPGLIFLQGSGRKGMLTVSAKYTVKL